MRNYLFCVFTCLLSLITHAQDSARNRAVRIYAAAQGGLVVGATEAAPVVQVTGGVAWSRWRVGLGTGIDWYQYRSIPLLATAEYRLPLLGNRLALYTSGGLNLPKAAHTENLWEAAAKERAGAYAEGGLAFYLPVSGRHAVQFRIGYSEKRYNLDRSGIFWCATGNCPPRTNIYSYRLRRLGVQAGWTL